MINITSYPQIIIVLTILSISAQADAESEMYGGISPISTNKSGFKVFVGEKTSELLSGDLQYIDFGKLKHNTDTAKPQSLGYSLLLKKTLFSRTQAFAKLGVHYWKADLSTPGNSFSSSGTDLFWGLGVNFSLGHSWFMRVEHERFKFKLEPAGNLSVKLNSASLIKKF